MGRPARPERRRSSRSPSAPRSADRRAGSPDCQLRRLGVGFFHDDSGRDLGRGQAASEAGFGSISEVVRRVRRRPAESAVRAGLGSRTARHSRARGSPRSPVWPHARTVTHYANPRFWRCHRALPLEIRQLADRNYKLLKANPGHRSLQFKQVGQDLRSVRVGLHHRALGVATGTDLIWFWIGSHAEYQKPSPGAARRRSLHPPLARTGGQRLEQAARGSNRHDASRAINVPYGPSRTPVAGARLELGSSGRRRWSLPQQGQLAGSFPRTARRADEGRA